MTDNERNDDKTFSYSYSAPTANERREIENIRRHYENPTLTQKDEKIERLKMLDKKVRAPGILVSVLLGVVGVLLFGLGLTMCLQWMLYLWGSAVCAIGIVFMSIAYPVRKRIDRRRKEKYGEEILALSNELLG